MKNKYEGETFEIRKKLKLIKTNSESSCIGCFLRGTKCEDIKIYGTFNYTAKEICGFGHIFIGLD